MMTTEPQPTKSKEFGIYAIKDELTGKFYNPLFIETEAEAKRYFEYVLNDNKMWKDNASMYSLFYLGSFSDHDGILTHAVDLVIGGLSVRKE